MDIHEAFQRRMEMDLFGRTTSRPSEPQEPLTIEKLQSMVNSLPPPPPRIQYSRYATKLPTARPHTLDMQEMVDRLGRQRVPSAFRVKLEGRDTYIIHPDLIGRDSGK